MKLVVHKAAAIFPMMDAFELKEVAKSITLYGLREKIGVVQNLDNLEELLVIDGRNRLEALRSLKIDEDVIIREYTQTIDLASIHATVEEYILMANIERRNLTRKQRKDLAGKLVLMFQENQKELPKEKQEDSLQKAADAAGVSRRTAANAKADLFKSVKKGTPSAAGPTKKAKEPHVAAKTIITRLEADLSALKTFGPSYQIESLETIAEWASKMSTMAREHVIGVAKAAEGRIVSLQEKAAEAQAALDHGDDEEGDDAA